MKPSPPQESLTVAEFLRKRLEATDHSVEELAEFVEVPKPYIDDLVSGRRRPPLPGRTDLYDKMTSFLGLARNELAGYAQTERDASAPAKVPSPKPNVRRRLLTLCEPATAERLDQRSARAELAAYIQRLLGITQTAMRRMLDDKMKLRLAARASAESYAAARLQVLEFLDTTTDTLTPEHVEKYLVPRVALWDVDFETGVLRVVMHSELAGGMSSRPMRAAS